MTPANRIEIKNGRLIDPANGVDERKDLFVEDGKVCAIGKPPEGFKPDLTIDAEGQVVCPGLVDLSARVREPGQEHKATIESETRAAAKGGITTICCPPDTNPIIDTPAVASMIYNKSMDIGYARILPIGALTQGLEGSQLSEMVALTRAECPVLSNAYEPLANTLVERRALEYAATFGITVFIRPEDRHLRNNGCVHEGLICSRLGLPGIPEAAESVAVARDLALADHTRCTIHFHALSTARALRMIEGAQKRGVPITANVAAHQLHLTEECIEEFNSNCHVIPPLRTREDLKQLREGIARGTIKAICSDHQPHDSDAKQAPFPSTAPGISSLETLLGLTLELVDEGIIEMADAIARLTSGPAEVLGLPLGQLGVEADADICIFDPKKSWQLTTETMLSAGKNTPFLDREFTGQVTHTLFQGRVVYKA
ncbi:MAG: dihydroorotase [Gammaproteobacteria bacterium]|nr:dihydroorotase [Gammaproteobacteria bacterium]